MVLQEVVVRLVDSAHPKYERIMYHLVKEFVLQVFVTLLYYYFYYYRRKGMCDDDEVLCCPLHVFQKKVLPEDS